MLLANRRVAERIGRKRGAVEPKTFVYRIHDQPSPEKLNQFIQFVAKLGYKMRISTERNLAKSFNELFEKLKGRERKTLWKHLLYAPWLKPNIQLKYRSLRIGFCVLHPFYFTYPSLSRPDGTSPFATLP